MTASIQTHDEHLQLATVSRTCCLLSGVCGGTKSVPPCQSTFCLNSAHEDLSSASDRDFPASPRMTARVWFLRMLVQEVIPHTSERAVLPSVLKNKQTQKHK